MLRSLWSKMKPLRWVILFSALLIGISASAQSRKPANPNLYSILGVNADASRAEMEAQFQFRLQNAQLSNRDLTRLQFALSFLSNSERRRQYDQGETIRVPFNDAEKESIAQYLAPIDPTLAARLRSTGSASLEALSSIPTFYLALALSSAAQCFQTNDPVYCKAYLASLKDPGSQLGFGAFMATSHLTQTTVQKLFGEKMLARTLGSFGGLAAGSLASSVVSDLAHLPEAKAYWQALGTRKLSDAEKNKLLHAIASKTVLDQKWWNDKAPELSALLASAYASQLTTRKISQWIAKPQTGLTLAGSPCSPQTLLQKIVTGEGIASPALRFAQRRGMELSHLLVFMAYESVLHPQAQKIWDQVYTEGNLRSANEKFAQSLKEGKIESPVRFSEALSLNAKQWEDSRQAKLSPIAESMNAHAEDLKRFDLEIEKPHAYYQFLQRGARIDSPEFAELKKNYYPEDTSDAVILTDSKKFLRPFFKGAEVSQSFQDATTLHGIPVGSLNPYVNPYRVLETPLSDRDDQTEAALLKRIQEPSYQNAERHAFSRVRELSQSARFERLKRYEEQISSKVLSSFEQAGPNSILSSIEKQKKTYLDFKKLSSNLNHAKEHAQELDQAIELLDEEKKAVNAVLKYYQTAPEARGEFNLDENSLESWVKSAEGNEWQKSIDAYRGLILR